MKRKLFSLMLCLIMVASCSLGVFAAAPTEAELKESSILDEMLVNMEEKYDFVEVYDENGSDCTEAFERIYFSEGKEAAINFIRSNNYIVHLREHVKDTNANTRADTISKSVTDYFVHQGTSNVGGFTKEWAIRLAGSFWYDRATGEIKSANSPNLSIYHASFGASFTPWIDNVRTSSSINTGTNTVTFVGTHTMHATLSASIGSLPIGFNMSFGTYTDRLSYTN